MMPQLYFSATLEMNYSLLQAVLALRNEFGATNMSLATKGNITYISIKSQTGNVLLRNSFLPDIKLTIPEEDAEVSVRFVIKRSVVIVMVLCLVMAIIFEIALLISFFVGELSTPALLAIPAGIAVYSGLLSYFGMRTSSLHLMHQLTEMLSGTEAATPKLRFRSGQKIGDGLREP